MCTRRVGRPSRVTKGCPAAAQASTPPARLFNRETQLGLWTQRAHFQQWFPTFDPTHYGSEQDLPYDVDHILPKAYNNLRGRVRWKYGGPAPEFRRWRWRVLNGPGNLRYWPASLNRSDGKKNLADKYLLGPEERETPEGSLLRAYKLNNIADVRAASEIDLVNVPDWEVGANARKPYDWRDAARIKALRQATDNRRLTMYRRFYEGVGYAAWHQRFEPWLAEVIKNRVLDLWIQQAREDGNSEVHIYVRDVQEELGMLGILPLIHQVFDKSEFLFAAGVTGIRRGDFSVEEEFHWVISL